MFKKEESLEILQLLGLITNMNGKYIGWNEYIITLKKNMIEEKLNQEFRLKNISETRNYFIA